MHLDEASIPVQAIHIHSPLFQTLCHDMHLLNRWVNPGLNLPSLLLCFTGSPVLGNCSLPPTFISSVCLEFNFLTYNLPCTVPLSCFRSPFTAFISTVINLDMKMLTSDFNVTPFTWDRNNLSLGPSLFNEPVKHFPLTSQVGNQRMVSKCHIGIVVKPKAL